MKRWFAVAYICVALVLCAAFAQDKKEAKPILMSDTLRKAVQDAHKPIDDLEAKQKKLHDEFNDIQSRTKAIQDEFNANESGRPLLQRKYDAAVEAAFKAVGLENEEDKWDVDFAAGKFTPKVQPSSPATATPAGSAQK